MVEVSGSIVVRGADYAQATAIEVTLEPLAIGFIAQRLPPLRRDAALLDD